MAKLELAEETKAGMEEVGTADLLIAVAVQVDADQLRAAATQAVLNLGAAGQPGEPSLSALRTVVAFPGPSGVDTTPEAEAQLEQAATSNALRFLPYALAAGSPENSLACPLEHLPGGFRHRTGAGRKRVRSHWLRSRGAAE